MFGCRERLPLKLNGAFVQVTERAIRLLVGTIKPDLAGCIRWNARGLIFLSNLLHHCGPRKTSAVGDARADFPVPLSNSSGSVTAATPSWKYDRWMLDGG